MPKSLSSYQAVIIEYIETFYNCRNLYSALGDMPPSEYGHQFNHQVEAA